MPCSIDRDTVLPDITTLCVSPKADGVRYLLCLCTDNNSRPIATLVSRAEECFSVSVSAPESWYRLGCVFDGEMCDNLNNPIRKIYLVFNVLCFRGEAMFHRSYRDRVSALSSAVPTDLLGTEGQRRAFGRGVLTSANDMFDIVAKPVHPASSLRELLNETRPYKTDGVVFTPTHDPMTKGRNPKILKWKANNTVDARLVVHDDNTFELITADHGVPVPLQEVMAHTLVMCDVLQSIVRGHRLFQKLINIPPSNFDFVVELSVTPGMSPMFTFVCLRTDKTNPNDLYTVQRTVVAAESAISAEQLCDMVDRFL